MKTLLLADHDNKTLSLATRSAVTAASALGAPVTLLVAGHGAGAIAAAAAGLAGVAEVVHADAPCYAHPTAEDMTALVMDLLDGVTHLVAPATAMGKSVLPRVAALRDVAQVSDVVAIEGADVFVRPVYAGNALARVRNPEPLKILTVRPTAFARAGDGGAAPILVRAASQTNPKATFLEASLSSSERPALTAARVVVAGGRGVGSLAMFKKVEELADKLGGAVGASRAAVDAGYVTNDCQIGQTGKVVAPDLFIAFGISGAIQHVSGILGSKVIVAVDKDPDAPIFQVADYGLVGDVAEILPAMIEGIGK